MTSRSTVGITFSIGALSALILFPWISGGPSELIVVGVPALGIAGLLGHLARNYVVGISPFVSIVIGIAIADLTLCLVPLLYGITWSLTGALFELRVGAIRALQIVQQYGFQVALFGGFSGIAAYFLAKRSAKPQSALSFWVVWAIVASSVALLSTLPYLLQTFIPGSHEPIEVTEASKTAVLASLSKTPTASEVEVAIGKYGAGNVLWGLYSSDRFEYVLAQIRTADQDWYRIAKSLRWEADAGASEELSEAIGEAEEKVPGLDPASPKVVFKGQTSDSFSGGEEAQELKQALTRNNIPFTTQVAPHWETVSWPRKYSDQVRKIGEKYYCDPDIPEERSFGLGESFKECLGKKGISFATAVCHGIEYIVVSEDTAKRVAGEESLCMD